MKLTHLHLGTACPMILSLLPGIASAHDADACIGKVPTLGVIAQGVPAVTALDVHLVALNAKWGTEVKITPLGENERRSKARLDASTGAGAYQVIYIDEANLAECASADWVYPLAEVVPDPNDIKSFRVDLANVASYNCVQYFTPFVGGGDVLMYRKDVLEAKGIALPKTLDELVAAIKATNDPDNKLVGTRSARLGDERLALDAVHPGGGW